MRCLSLVCGLVAFSALIGCERKGEPVQKGGAAAAPAKDEPVRKDADGHDQGSADIVARVAEDSRAGHGGEVIDLGSATIGAFNVRASRDKGETKPGGDAPIDVWIDDGVGLGVTAVRFWIGSQDAKGSIKAKAAIEDGHWHTHVEIPTPLPGGSKLWVEVETDGQKAVGAFDLKS